MVQHRSDHILQFVTVMFSQLMLLFVHAFKGETVIIGAHKTAIDTHPS